MTELLEWFTGQDVELGWKFDPFEKRDEHGRWTKSGAGYTAPDPQRLKLSRRGGYQLPSDHPFFKAHPVSAANVVAAYDDSDAQERAQGMRWYADAHNLAKKMDHGDIEKNAGVIAALSPQTGWAVNMLNADRSLDLGRALGPGEGMITGSMQANAQKAIDGMKADAANSSSKTKAFARLIRYGGDEPGDTLGQVVVDRHAMTVAMGKRIPKKEGDKAPIDKDRFYQYVADTYRNAALEISKRGTPITPHQLQAITWLRQQRINEAEDEAHSMGEAVTEKRGGRRLAKGRATSLRNAWQKWMAEAERHDYPLVPGTTGLQIAQYANELLSAQILDMVFNPAEMRDAHGRWTKGGTIEKIVEPIGMEGARGNSRAVSHDEFQRLAAEGKQRLHDIQHQKWGTDGLDRNWPQVKERLWHEVQKSWGGATTDPRTGEDLPQGAEKWAMSIKPSGLDTTSVGEHASRADYEQAMDIARTKYHNQLAKGGSYLGVFHDDDLGRIDIDPVTVLDSLREVETIGAYTHAIGGAYKFSDGNGYWPPHVAEGASMSNESVHFAGPGQWHSQAVEVQAPHDEEDDGEDEEPPTISAQVLQFSFNPLEKRDAHGKWTRGSRTEQMSLHKLMRAAAVPFVGAPIANEDEMKAAVVSQAAPASKIVPKLLGGNHEEWNGKAKIFLYDHQKEVLALMDWDGTLNMASNVAQAIQDDVSIPGEVKQPDAFEVLEHEMIHGVVPEGSAAANEKAYQVWAVSQIEEGFTELGATQHAAEFFKQMGIADRPTPRFPGHTVHEMAVAINDPEEIANGNGWKHYPSQTKDAQDWVQQIAKENGSNPNDVAVLTELADEVNVVGAADKVGVMAIQLADAMTKDPKQRADRAFINNLADTIAAQHPPAVEHRRPGGRGQGGVRLGQARGPAEDGRDGDSGMTPLGQQALAVAKWAWEDPPGRVQIAIEQVRGMASAATGDELTEIQDAGTMLHRLAGTLDTEPVDGQDTILQQLAGDTLVSQLVDLARDAWRNERRGPHGEWVGGGGGGCEQKPGRPDQAVAASERQAGQRRACDE